MKLNWRDASKELPETDNDLITYLVIDMNNKFKPVFLVGFDGVHFWANDHDYGAEIITATHWIPADELPLPNDE